MRTAFPAMTDPSPLGTLISVYGHIGQAQQQNGQALQDLQFDGHNASTYGTAAFDSSSDSQFRQQAFDLGSGSGVNNSINASNDIPLATTDDSLSDGNRTSVKGKRKESPMSAKEDVKPKRARKVKSKKGGSDDGDSDSVQEEEEDGSERTRFRWTDELHQYFLACIFEMGLEAASPKKVYMKMMADPQFAKTILDEEEYDQLMNPESNRRFGAHHVKSHLQRFRSNIVQPRLAFIKQLCELMKEAKRKKKEEGHKQNKVLNPEYHAYPFAMDRTFPDNMANSELASVVSSGAALLKATAQTHGGPVPPSSLGSGGLYASAAAEYIVPPVTGPNGLVSALSTLTSSVPPPPAQLGLVPSRGRTLSSYEADEQFRAQVEMRERIESLSQRQVVQAPEISTAAPPMDYDMDFSNVLNIDLEDDDKLFGWLQDSET